MSRDLSTKAIGELHRETVDAASHIDAPQKESKNFDIENIEHEIGILRLTIVRDLRSFFHAETKRQSDHHQGLLKLHVNSMRSVLPVVLSGLSCTSQAFSSVVKLTVPLAEHCAALSGLNFSADILKQTGEGTALADAVLKVFKDFTDNSLAASRYELNVEGAKSLSDLITQTYKKYQQEENDILREIDQREGRKADTASGIAQH